MPERKDTQPAISIQAFRRLPQYYTYLRRLHEAGIGQALSPIIAKHIGPAPATMYRTPCR